MMIFNDPPQGPCTIRRKYVEKLPFKDASFKRSAEAFRTPSSPLQQALLQDVM